MLASEGQLQNDGTPQADPRGHASWGDYLITLVHNSYYDQVFDNAVYAGSGSTDDEKNFVCR